MKKYLLILALFTLVGCLNTQGQEDAAEGTSTFLGILGDAGVPGAGLGAMAAGVLAEFIRGRKEKKNYTAQAGALHRSVNSYLDTLPEADVKLAKIHMNKALVGIVGTEKAGKATTLLKKAKELSSKLHN